MSEWPEGISDGLTLPCGVCGDLPPFDYRVTDWAWQHVVPEALRLGVVCLPCFDMIAEGRGIDIAAAIQEVQFTGVGKTVVLRPSLIHRYRLRAG